MTIHYDECPACGEPLESWAHFDWHRRVEHLREDEPCERCGQWGDEPTEPGPGGAWMHRGCATQLGYEQAQDAVERREGAA